jgi:F-type H+-transporting ATPase subunit gamma
MPLADVRPAEKILIVLMTSDKGLCGGFNANLIKKARQGIADKYATQQNKGNVTVLTIGKKGMEATRRLGYTLNDAYTLDFANPSFEKATPVAEQIIAKFLAKEYDVVELVFSQFKNAILQIPTDLQLLPIATLNSNGGTAPKTDYIIEPNQAQIINSLMPAYIKTQFYRCLLDTNASEHGARMTSMDKATENAGDLIKELKLLYNRARQAAITTEITEIVGGAAALQG